ncbi:phosphodiesterase [Pseudoalteromonas sp. BMB]|uniref:HD-GYP domain-containing protein n=1 Tax=Pseudoalteromonas sp. BMB TaxID=1874619 RepID=UPI00083D2666|nr:HD-GYP domain-containing protein [Pseudoalteromonas sp. BMB]ODB34149.1 phosphodiesterase [Pseudoalteromonas sp. BMB]
MPEININISDLEPGMFVVGVTKQTGSVAIKTKGWVRTKTSITKLQKSGVLEVTVDPSKRLSEHDPHDEPPHDENIEEPHKPEHDPWQTKCNVDAEMQHAVTLYDEAKAIQSKAFADIKAGKAIEIEAFKATASGFIDSVFRNQDALSCIARIREKDAYLLEHSINVSILMAIFCKHLGYSRELTEEMTTGALLHDIGKIEIPDDILHKPGKLSLDEYGIMKSHAKYSFDILLNAGLGRVACEIAGYHHERLDGTGYPYGKTADELPQHVRMAAIVDVYDALTAERIYKEGMTPIKAFKLMREGCPHHFDEQLLSRFIACIGVYPVGTLVKLTSGKVGVIAQSNPKTPLKPVVKVFYHAKHMHYIEVQDIDLSAKKANDELESAIKPEEFKLDLIRFFKHSMLP